MQVHTRRRAQPRARARPARPPPSALQRLRAGPGAAQGPGQPREPAAAGEQPARAAVQPRRARARAGRLLRPAWLAGRVGGGAHVAQHCRLCVASGPRGSPACSDTRCAPRGHPAAEREVVAACVPGAWEAACIPAAHSRTTGFSMAVIHASARACLPPAHALALPCPAGALPALADALAGPAPHSTPVPAPAITPDPTPTTSTTTTSPSPSVCIAIDSLTPLALHHPLPALLSFLAALRADSRVSCVMAGMHTVRVCVRVCVGGAGGRKGRPRFAQPPGPVRVPGLCTASCGHTGAATAPGANGRVRCPPAAPVPRPVPERPLPAARRTRTRATWPRACSTPPRAWSACSV